MATEPLPPPCDWPRDACHFSGEIQSLRDKNDALRAELAESREQLTRELKIALEAKSALRARVAELEARRSLPMDSITITIAEWDRVTGERDRLRAEVDAFREDAANYYRVAKEADAQQAALRARVADGDVVRGDLQTVADVLRDYEGETVWQQAQAAVARVAELEADVRDARGLLRGMIDAKDGRVARFLIERAERFIERAAGNKEGSRE